MLRWRAATTREAALAVQDAIYCRPHEIDPRQLYYYVTLEDIHDALGRNIKTDFAGPKERQPLFEGIEKEGLYELNMPYGPSYRPAFFATEQALRDAGANLEPWPSPQSSGKMKHGDRVRRTDDPTKRIQRGG